MRILLLCLIILASACFADDYRTFTVTAGSSTSTVANPVTNFADDFTGEIDEIAVYTTSGVTGAVVVATIDPYSGTALVLATNEAVTGYRVWRPRIEAPAPTGSTVFVVTNTASADKFYAHGEKVRGIVSGASKTSSVFRIFLKIKN